MRDRPGSSSNIWLILVGILVVIALTVGVIVDLRNARKRSSARKPAVTEGAEPSKSSDAGGTLEFEPEPLATMPVTATAKEQAEQLENGVRASADSWPTEAFSEQATARLKKLAKHIGRREPIRGDALFADNFQSDPLKPKHVDKVYLGNVTVERWSSRSGRSAATASTLSDPEVALAALFDGLESPQAAFKIVRVARTNEGFTTAVFAEGGGVAESARTQWTAIWNCKWTNDARLRAISLQDYESVVSSASAEPWFVDATAAVIGKEASYREQLLYGMDYWVNRIEHRLHANRLGHHGLAIGDVNGDGLEDLYVCQPGGLPNRLYLHQEDGTASERSESAGVDVLDDTTAALLVDLDNDGDQDLGLLTVSGGYLFENDGVGNFKRRVDLADCRNAFSLTAADFDRDGNLDLYVGRYWPEESVRGAIPLPVPYYDARNGGSNVLFRNFGDWKFADVTEEAGLNVDNTRYTMAAAWEDYDNDGDQDLYVANDFGRNCLYNNDRGRFRNAAPELGVEDTAAGMSVSWADFDHDGQQDLYVGNMFSSAGGRITYQRQYSERFDAVAQQKLQRLARGNSLFRNRGNQFDDVSVESNVTLGRWAWGSVFIDLNNDSWEDLVVANGHVTTEDTGDL